jgi:hypothetical protein
MTDSRKSIHQLKVEHDEDRRLYGRSFVHNATGEDYHLLFCAFDEATNEKLAVYGLSAMPWMKFTRPFAEFKERFTEGRSTDLIEKEQ